VAPVPRGSSRSAASPAHRSGSAKSLAYSPASRTLFVLHAFSPTICG
jgi:hypothetical protein